MTLIRLPKVFFDDHAELNNLVQHLGGTPVCPYCNNDAKLVDGSVIYPHRPDLARLNFWQCKPCDAYVGCHRSRADGGTGDGTLPLGRLANAELRAAKQQAHEMFDPLWRGPTAIMKRGQAYRELAAFMGLRQFETHIGAFDVEQCKRVIEFVLEKEINATPPSHS